MLYLNVVENRHRTNKHAAYCWQVYLADNTNNIVLFKTESPLCLGQPLRVIYVTDDHGYVQFVVVTIPSSFLLS